VRHALCLCIDALGHKVAILVVNTQLANQSLALPLADIPSLKLMCDITDGSINADPCVHTYSVRDVWNHKDATDILRADGKHLEIKLAAHASDFYIIGGA
jgi:hypothetical protein